MWPHGRLSLISIFDVCPVSQIIRISSTCWCRKELRYFLISLVAALIQYTQQNGFGLFISEKASVELTSQCQARLLNGISELCEGERQPAVCVSKVRIEMMRKPSCCFPSKIWPLHVTAAAQKLGKYLLSIWRGWKMEFSREPESCRSRNRQSRWAAISSCRWKHIPPYNFHGVRSKREVGAGILRKDRIAFRRLGQAWIRSYDKRCENYWELITWFCSSCPYRLYPTCKRGEARSSYRTLRNYWGKP